MEQIDIQKKVSSYSREAPEPKIYEGVVRDARFGLDITGGLWRWGIGRSRREASMVLLLFAVIVLIATTYLAKQEIKKEVPAVSREQMNKAMEYTIKGETVPMTSGHH